VNVRGAFQPHLAARTGEELGLISSLQRKAGRNRKRQHANNEFPIIHIKIPFACLNLILSCEI